jgi:hypothetical protein
MYSLSLLSRIVKRYLMADKRFDKLLTALRTAVAEEYQLKKEDTSYNDILDAFKSTVLQAR